MKGNKSILLVLISAVFAFIIILVGWRYSVARVSESENVVTNKKISEASIETYEEALVQINQLYTSDDRIYLKKDSSNAKIKELKIAVENSSEIEKKEELLTILQTAQDKREIEDELNSLFDSPKISDGVINSEVKMKTKVSASELSEVESLINQSGITDDFAKQVLLAIGSDAETGNSTTISEDDSRYLAAKEALAVIVQNGQPVLGFTWEQYETAKNAIAEVPESTQKEELLAQLKVVQDVLISMGMST